MLELWLLVRLEEKKGALDALRPPRPAPEDEWIPLREAAQGTPYSQDYLSLLARKGRLEAVKRGRNWVTTRRAVEGGGPSLH